MAARIRSIHPGFFTDEQLVECSHAARLLLIGLLTECDDQGVFEWKPKRLKMTLFPAEDLPLAPLLKELEVANAIRQYAVDGKDYGAVRNFRKFQRPQKPNDIYPRTPEIDDYVGPKHKRKGGARSSDDAERESGLFGDGRGGGDYRTGSAPAGVEYDTGTGPEGSQYDTDPPSGAAKYDTDPPPQGSEYGNDPPPGTPRVRESGEQMEEGGGRKKPHHGVSSPSSRDSAPVDAGRAREDAEIAKWQPRLDGYRPWEGKTTWLPGWGPRPDSAGRNPFIPESLLKPWREAWQAALSRRPASVAASAA